MAGWVNLTLTARTSYQLGQYASSRGNMAYCYAELDILSQLWFGSYFTYP